MIRAVRCDQPGFKGVTFTPGFNVVLAERTKESTKKDSRNGLGKTTLIEIIHFCLGAAATRNKGLLREPLFDWTFSLDMTIRGRQITVSRNTAHPSEVTIQGDLEGWPAVRPADLLQEITLPVRDWSTMLGWLMFDLTPQVQDELYSPTFRSLISYFARRGRDAYSIPFEHHRKQLEWDKQVNNAFLLGLAWEDAQSWQILRDREKALSALKQGISSGFMSDFVGSIGELETLKVRLEERVSRGAEELAGFRVHPQYRQIEDEANALTSRIHELTNQNLTDRRLIEFYESSFRDERAPDDGLVSEVYAEAGVLLPDNIVNHLEEVHDFHLRIVANRRNFLESEITRLNGHVSTREREIRDLGETRAQLLSVLQTHGALEEYSQLQHRQSEAVQQLTEVNARIANLKRLEQGRSALRIEQEHLRLKARSDYEERAPVHERAISLFDANSEALYEAPGRLVIDFGPTGFKFEVEIERSTSQGIEQMKVFCYDLMLAELWSAKEPSPGFLIHDSTVFDGVDERQVAQGIQLAAQKAESARFQYICCMNSDTIPTSDFSPSFAFEQYVRLVLTDSRPDGGLLGVRF